MLLEKEGVVINSHWGFKKEGTLVDMNLTAMIEATRA